jgi:hypothetical protein
VIPLLVAPLQGSSDEARANAAGALKSLMSCKDDIAAAVTVVVAVAVLSSGEPRDG